MQENQKELFGHPRGLFLLFLTEMWERFSYYGMRGLLILFLTKSLMEGGLGFEKGHAGQIYGIYTSLVYLTPLIGGWLADNYLGQRWSITIGGITMALGQFALFYCASSSSISLLYLGLGLLIIGNGFFKPNISTVVGKLYPQGDKRRDSAFTIFYMGINLGAFLAPLICGYLAEDYFAIKQTAADGSSTVAKYGFQYGFLAAGFGMVLGQILFNLLARQYLGNIGVEPDAKVERAKANGNTVAVPLTPEERQRIIVIGVMVTFVIFFWAGFEQAGSTLSLYTDSYINRNLGGFLIPTSWFQSVNPLFIVILGPVFTWLWLALSKEGREPNTIIKMGLGMILLGLGFLLMLAAAAERGGDNPDVAVKASLWWLVGTYLIHTMGELCLSPVGLSMVTKLAPARLASLLMGVWLLSSFVANYIAGATVEYVERMGSVKIFTIIAGVTIALGIIVLLISKKLVKMTHGRL
ncbi:MAG: peptide MFS transporter [Saprospiraceae bacterium]|nr:peptide MFS transporter [Saprospiraceae bacterium]MBP7679615.1 peptide MFS transporter [Saprospiraceae bacterium]